MTIARSWICGAAVLAAIACAPPLPSETALGTGTGAEPEPESAPRAGDKTAPQVDPSAAAGEADVSSDQKPADPKPATTTSQTPSASPDSPKKADDRPLFFAGLYGGLYEAEMVLTKGQGATKRVNPKARVRVERHGDDEATLTFMTADGEPAFGTLSVKVDANNGTIPVGQTWSGPPELGNVSGTVTRGAAKVEARRLSVDFDVQVESFGGTPAGGKVRVHFHGWRPLG